MAATKTAKKKTANKKTHPVQTPGGYIVTGLIMWLVGYLLFILAVDSGSLLQWAGVFVAVIWGLVRIIEGSYQLIKKK
jgi:uncharacterized membrane protein